MIMRLSRLRDHHREPCLPCHLLLPAWYRATWPSLSAIAARPAAGNRSGCACASSPSPAAGADCGSDSPNAGPGPGSSPPRPPACRPSRLADQPEQPRRPGRRNRQGPWNPAHPARQPGNQARPHAENQPQPNTSGHQNRVIRSRLEAADGGRICRIGKAAQLYRYAVTRTPHRLPFPT
jgi:hypothetical protein